MTGIRSNVIYIGGQKISASGNSLYINDAIVGGGGGGVSNISVTGLSLTGNVQLTGNSNLNPFVSGGKIVFNTLVDGTLATGTLPGQIFVTNIASGSARPLNMGIGSTDLQKFRANSNQTSLGDHSIILGGTNNIVSGICNIVVGTFGSKNSQLDPTYIGTQIYGYSNAVVGGLSHLIVGDLSFIGGGTNNIIRNTLRAPFVRGSVIAGGTTNKAYAPASFIGGGASNTVGTQTPTFGDFYGAIINGIGNNLVGGHNTIIGGGSNTIKSSYSRYSFIGNGRVNLLSGVDKCVILNGYTNTINLGSYYSTIGNGSRNTITAGYSSNILGGLRNFVSGTDNTIINGRDQRILGSRNIIGNANTSVITGTHSSIIGGYKNKIENSNYGNINGGYFNTVREAQFSLIGNGTRNYISGNNNVILNGTNNRITGLNNIILYGSGNLVTSSFASANGNMAEANRWGQQSFSSFPFNSERGSAQKVSLLGQVITTSEVPVVLLNGITTGFLITAGKGFAFTANIFGSREGGADMAQYIRQGIIKNVGGTTSLVGSINTIGTDIESNPLTNVAITANDTSDTLDIAVSGVNGQNWRWLAQVEGVEIKF
jgi:hypothetical protein